MGRVAQTAGPEYWRRCAGLADAVAGGTTSGCPPRRVSVRCKAGALLFALKVRYWPSPVNDDYVAFLEGLFATATTWHVLCDNLNVHLSEGVVRLVARLYDVTDEPGEKRKSGILALMATREARLCDANHRIIFHFAPKRASRMVPIEIRFSILVRTITRASGSACWQLPPH